MTEALLLAEVDPSLVQANFGTPLASWPEHDEIIRKLWNKYSRVLDIRIAGERPDFVLWDAIDIRHAFGHPTEPASEHLCIAVLILEGAIQSIASANWDGFIEAAVERLAPGVQGILQVVVDPNQLRSPPGRARLLKFHGCIVHATREPLIFRDYLTGSYTQIMAWPEAAQFAAMCNAIVGIATNQKALVVGLSIQDNNLQTIFTRAKQVHAWPWPCTPAAPGHVFCEDSIQQGQRDVLRLVYGDAYNLDPVSVHTGTHLRAWGEQVLIALVLKLLADKLVKFMDLSLAEAGKSTFLAVLATAVTNLRDTAANIAAIDPATGNRTPYVNLAITSWSRALSLFRNGCLPARPDGYQALSTSALCLIDGDQNAQALKLGRLSIALSLLQHGIERGQWTLSKPASYDLTSGAMTARSTRADAIDRPVFIVKSATEAIALKQAGAFANDNALIIHGDDMWDQLTDGVKTARRVRAAPGRTGLVTEIHVSLGKMLASAADAASLQQQFLSKVIL